MVRRCDGVLVHFQPGDGGCAASPVCTDRNIPRLVYTSTINVVFTGEPIKECDESSASYVPPDKVSITSTPFLPVRHRFCAEGVVLMSVPVHRPLLQNQSHCWADDPLIRWDPPQRYAHRWEDDSAAAEQHVAQIPIPLERVSGSRVFFTLTGAGPLLSSVRVTLHPFTYSVKPKAKSCLLMSRSLKVNSQTSLAPPTFLPGTCAVRSVNVALLWCLFYSLHVFSVLKVGVCSGPAPCDRAGSTVRMRGDTSTGWWWAAGANTEWKKMKRGFSGVCPAEWALHHLHYWWRGAGIQLHHRLLQPGRRSHLLATLLLHHGSRQLTFDVYL